MMIRLIAGPFVPRSAAIKAVMAALVLGATAFGAVPASAHGLLMKADAEGRDITGRVFFSNGEPASDVWVEQFAAQSPETALKTVQADEAGAFTLQGAVGQSYLLVATGEEGHTITMEIALDAETARAGMVPDREDAAAQSAFETAPAWMILGGLLAASLVPAVWLRRKRNSPA